MSTRWEQAFSPATDPACPAAFWCRHQGQLQIAVGCAAPSYVQASQVASACIHQHVLHQCVCWGMHQTPLTGYPTGLT